MAANWTQLTLAAMSIVVLLSFVPLGSSIKCYQCSSKFNTTCAETLPQKLPEPGHWAHKYIVDCDDRNVVKSNLDNDNRNAKASFCRKQVQEIEGTTRIVRSCGFVKGDRDCYSTANPPTKTYVCQCSSDDLCNSALNVHSSVLLMSLCGLIGLWRLY